jgi:cytochrome o ubiquinol oxidase operon protein cyoD
MTDQEYSRDLHSYLIGFGLALVLTLVPFALVIWGGLTFGNTLIVLGVCAVVQLLVQLRFFLHIDFSRQKREDLHLILFSCLLLSIMAGGTIWIVANLAVRMN